MTRHPRQWPRIVLTLAALALALLHLGGVLRLPFVDALDAFFYDTRLRATLPGTPDERIVIVDIDDASLRQHGQWPWRRERLAQLTRELTGRQRAAVVGFDMMFVEAEHNPARELLHTLRQSPWRGDILSEAEALAQLERLSAATDGDRQFAAALRGQPTVLGFYLSRTAQGGGPGALPPAVLQDGLLPAGADRLPRWNSHGASLPPLAAVASAGFLNVVLDPKADGVVRAVPLLARYQPTPDPHLADAPLLAARPADSPRPGAAPPAAVYYESLGLAVYRTLMQAQAPILRTTAPRVGPPRLHSLLLPSAQGLRTVPVDATGQMHIPYRGPGGPQGGVFRYVSAAQVMAGGLPAGELAGKVVLIGTSATGLRDLAATPVGAVFPGVEIHANVVSALLDGRFITVPDYADGFAAGAAVLLIGGLALALNFWRGRRVLVGVAAATAALLGITHLLYLQHGLVLPLAAVLLSVGLAVGLNLGWGYLVETRARRSLARLFGIYVPPQLVRTMLADPERYTMQAESKELTVMFCDMRGFTHLSEGLSPAELQPLLNEIFSRLTAVISRHRGTVDKYMGDCVMAFWGAPVDTPEHAHLAVQAAFEIVAEVDVFNEQQRAAGRPTVQVGIGINTGVMHVGDMGSALRRSYTVIGDAVNLASRLEGLSEFYGVPIVAGPTTREQASAYLWQELDLVQVRGRQQAVAIATPCGVRAQATSDQRRALQTWQALRAAYLARRWDEAHSLLRQLQATGSDKKFLYALYAQRLALLAAQPPGPEWDGIEHFPFK